MYRIEEKDGEKCVVFYDPEDFLCGANEYSVLFSRLDWFGARFDVKRGDDFYSFLDDLDAAWLDFTRRMDVDNSGNGTVSPLGNKTLADMRLMFNDIVSKRY